MDDNKNSRPDPWEPGKYETGRTKPPKSHTGLIAMLLVVVIFLGGLVSFLGVLNVKLFAQLKALPEIEQERVSFISETEETAPILDICEPTEPDAETGQITETEPASGTIVLNPSPDSIPNIPQAEGLSLQSIYDKSIGSVVSISCTRSDGTASGTGVIFDHKGYIVTNSHVVEGAQSIRVLLTDGREFPAAMVIAKDGIIDITTKMAKAMSTVT